jgi:hypothetical protein
MTIQPINLVASSFLFLLSLIFIGPLYLAFLSLVVRFYMIFTFFETENDTSKTIDTNNNTIMTRSRRRLQEERLRSQS